jgi:hypothetical protein
MAFGFPPFESRFLRTLAKSLDARCRALRHHDRVMVEFQHGDPGTEWLEFKRGWPGQEEISLFFRDTRAVWVFFAVRPPGGRRWEILCDTEFGPLFSHAELLQHALEETLTLASHYGLGERDSPDQLRQAIAAQWHRVQARIFG